MPFFEHFHVRRTITFLITSSNFRARHVTPDFLLLDDVVGVTQKLNTSSWGMLVLEFIKKAMLSYHFFLIAILTSLFIFTASFSNGYVQGPIGDDANSTMTGLSNDNLSANSTINN